MITGQNTFRIDWRDWSRGMTTSVDTEDGGFSPQTTGVNLVAQPGAINPPGALTDESTGLTGDIIASAEDPTYLGEDRMYLDDDGAFYTFSGTALTKEVTASSDKYTQGTTGFVAFNNKWYASTKAGSGGDITEWDGSSTLVEDWWTNATHLNQSALSNGTSWRPLLVWENQLWVGDKNVLRSVDKDDNVTAPLTIALDEAIVSLGIDKSTGKMLIGVTTSGSDYSGTRKGEDKVLVYDGSSPKVDSVVYVDGTVTCFHNTGRELLTFYDNFVGQWTGRGIKYLRTLDIDYTGGELIYPHMVTTQGNSTHIAEESRMLTYGPVVSGQGPVFYYQLTTPSGTNITNLSPVGDGGEIGVAYKTDEFGIYDPFSVSASIENGVSIYTRKYKFNKKVNFKGLRMSLKTSPTASSSTVMALHYIDSAGTDHTIKTVDIISGELEIDFQGTDVYPETSSLQFYVEMDPTDTSDVVSITDMVVYHDPAQE